MWHDSAEIEIILFGVCFSYYPTVTLGIIILHYLTIFFKQVTTVQGPRPFTLV